ncbi:Circadian clock-controlled protein [Papilio machaon]|uniref:Circadian clock-controlled protein n=1 Tax=Papilio machaon TaxID=76193 RepID=A0A194RA67_PAPMA|nr:Circadian clock-controlled protein [Papilio machaon]
MKTYLFAFLTFVLSGANGASAPFIKPCKLNDVECIKSSATAAIPFIVPGIPALGIPSSEPLHIQEAKSDQDEMKLTFKDLNIYGLSKSQFKNVEVDEAKSILHVDLETPLSAKGTYKLEGKILFIPAEGEGNIEIKTDKVRVIIDAKYTTITDEKGDKHWKITGYDYTYDLINKVYFVPENLFGGDATRAKPVLELFDHSWKELITEIGAPIIKDVVKSAVERVKKFFLAVPLSELVQS